MPGRHGKQVKKRNRSKRQPVTEMETLLKDSIHGRTRKERAILKDLVPPAVKRVARKIAVSESLPMFAHSLSAATASTAPPSLPPTERSGARAPEDKVIVVKQSKKRAKRR